VSDSSKDNPQTIVWSALSQIPEGRVTTYGQLAKLCGMPKNARYIGRLLGGLPSGTKLPWHRVINAQGRISFPPGSTSYLEQVERLRIEGVEFNGERISLPTYGWPD